MTRIEDLRVVVIVGEVGDEGIRWRSDRVSPLDLRLALGDVVVCDTCGGSGRTPYKINPGFTCVCHRGRGEQECQAHRMWDACPNCRNGVRLNPDKVEAAGEAAYEAWRVTDYDWNAIAAAAIQAAWDTDFT